MDFLRTFSNSFQDNWNLPALTAYRLNLTLTYGDIAARMQRIHMILSALGNLQGSRVAIIGQNSLDWIVAYMGALTYGAVPVSIPISAGHDEIVSLLNEVAIDLLFVDHSFFLNSFTCNDIPGVKAVISIDTQNVICSRMGNTCNPQAILDSIDSKFIQMFPYGFHQADAKAPVVAPDAPAAIFFTTGTTGRPKPVVLMADNLEGNIIFGIRNNLHPRHSRVLLTTSCGSVWGTIFNILVPLASGAHITILDNVTSTDALVEALATVRPQHIMLAPNYLDPIVRIAIKQFQSSITHRLFKHTPLHNTMRNMYMRKCINRLLGGDYRELIIGSVHMGTWLTNQLRLAQVRYTVVYGLTECGGLICYSPCGIYRKGTMGHPASPLVKCRLRPYSLDGYPENIGILEVRGMNLMKGYNISSDNIDRKLTNDGWFSTGDLCTIDDDGALTLYGRVNTLLSTKRGQVIPEIIEILFYEHPEVDQCILISHDRELFIKIYPDFSYIEKNYTCPVNDVIGNLVNEINRVLPLRAHIDGFILCERPMPTTWKGTVRREGNNIELND